MEKILNQVSCLIKAREYNVGFPGRFSHYPENMDSERMDKIHELALEAMQDPGSISESNGRVRRVIIGDGKYMVLGISGYLSSIMPDLSDEYHSFCDRSETRRTYGFAGFVWDLKANAALPQGFPEITEFAELFKAEILPHWMDSANSVWAENVQRGISVPYTFEVHCREDDILKMEKGINTNKCKVAVFRQAETVLIREAILWASKGHEVSLCTDLDYYEESGTYFMNLCSNQCKEERKLYDNVRYNVRGTGENEVKGRRKAGIPGNIESDTIHEKEKTEEWSRQNYNWEKREKTICIEFIFIINYRDEKKAQNDYKSLYQLIEECIRSVNGGLVDYGIQKTSVIKQILNDCWKERRIICEVSCPSDDVDTLLSDLSAGIKEGRHNGYLHTVELAGCKKIVPVDKGHGRRKGEDFAKKMTGKGILRNDSRNINGKNDESYDAMEQLTEQLTELFGGGGEKTPPKSNNAGSNPENPFSL